METLIIRVGELFLKKNNKIFFFKIFEKNINNLLSKFKFKLKRIGSIIILSFDNLSDTNISYDLLKKKLIGGSKISIGVKCNYDWNEIKKTISLIYDFKNVFSFKVMIRKNGYDNRFTTNQWYEEIAQYILNKNSNIVVNLVNPDLIIRMELLKNHLIICYKTEDMINGLPPGSSGEGIVMLSGGVDSCVASFLMMKRGMNVNYIHYYDSNENLDKVKKYILLLRSKLDLYQPSYNSKLYFIDFSLLKDEINCIKEKNYIILILKYFFYKMGKYILKEHNYDFIASGESIGQVSSQTIVNLNSLSSLSFLNIYRPLLVFNKHEIIEVAKFIDIFKYILNNGMDICTFYKKYRQKPSCNISFIKTKIYNETYNEIYNIIKIEKIFIVK